MAKSLAAPKIEKNIFSIAGRGHYENPISDLLAFFINPAEEHGLGNLFLRSLSQCMNNDLSSLELKSLPEREVCTRRGNKIDIILEGDDWVMVIENKLRHLPVNPFDDYVDYARSIFGVRNFHFVFLSIRDERPPQGWRPIKWEAYLKRITENLSEVNESFGSSKWPILAREFVLNVQQQCGDPPMSNESFEFVLKNYETIEEIQSMRERFFLLLTDSVRKIITDSMVQYDGFAPVEPRHDVGQRKRINEDWLRFYFAQGTVWHESNIALRLKSNGKFLLSIYVYGVAEQSVALLRRVIDQSEFPDHWPVPVKGRTANCFSSRVEREYESALKQVADVVGKLVGFMATNSNGSI